MLALAALPASIVQRRQPPILIQSLVTQELTLEELLAKTKTIALTAQPVNSVLQALRQQPDLVQMDLTAQLAQSSIRSMDVQLAKLL